MKHLDESELVDALERRAEPRVARHLQVCSTCRAQLEDLQLAAMHIAEEPLQTPPGAFWEHFGDRVNRAIDAPIAGRGWFTAQRLAWMGSFAAVLLALTAAVVLRDPGGGAEGPDEPAFAYDRTADLADDEAWTLVRALVAELDFDAVREAGIAPAAGAIDRAAVQLSDEEISALAELIEEELKRTES